MADKTISEFSALTTSNESIELIVNDAGETKKISRATLFSGDGSNLTGISGGGAGEANVQADWNQATTTDDAHILNKPNVQYTSAIANATASVTGLATATQITKLDGIEASATADQTNAEIKTAYEANADTNGFSDAEQTKLSGIATSANNYSHPSSDGNLHVPATSTSNNGKVLTAGSTAGALTWETAASGVNITSSATAPSSPSVGDQWFNTTTGVLSTYVTDGTDSAWLDISSANGLASSGGGGGGIGAFISTSIAISSDDTALANDDGTSNGNIGIGKNAGDNLTTGSNNIFLGGYADSGSASGANRIGIGYDMTVNADNRIVIGSGNVNRIYNTFSSSATWTRSSDARLKTEIEDSAIGLGFINDLRPVKYRWKSDASKTQQYGLIAQEVKAAMDAHGEPEFTVWDIEDSTDDGLQSLAYENLIVPLIKAVQELTARVEQLEN